MWLSRLALVLAGGYLVFSIVFIYRGGFAEPHQAMRVGLLGMIVMAVAMSMRTWAQKKKK